MPEGSLAQRASAAQAEGAFHNAAALWRRVLHQAPNDWQAAFALKAALAAAGQYAEGDAVFQQARRLFPDAPWLEHVASLYAFPQAELPSLIAQASRLAAASPNDPTRQSLLGHMLSQARDYAGAARAYANDPRPEARDRETQARNLDDMARWLATAPSFGPAPPIAVINLERNTERLEALHRAFAGSRPRRFRIPGIEASTLPDTAIAQLGGDPAMRGTLGCFLAHAAAWNAMLAKGLDFCLIVEDDVIPLFDLPERWGPFGLPADADICFVNHRMAPPAEARFRVYSLHEALGHFPPWQNAPGADGYLLTAEGARKLVRLVAQHGFAGDVDWRLLAYGLTAEQRALLPEDSHARSALSHQPHASPADRLVAAVLSPPLIRTVPLASDREDTNRGDAPECGT